MVTEQPLIVRGKRDSYCLIQPGRGGNISSVVSQKVELLALGHVPSAELGPGSDFRATGLAGWVDCFPSVAPEPSGSGNWGAIADHGDLWYRSWIVTDQEDHRVAMATDLPESGISAFRTVEWLGDVLQVSTSLSSNSRRALPFVLASHPLLACDESTWVDLPNAPVVWESHANWPHLPADLNQAWPATHGQRRVWRDLPASSSAKVFMPWPTIPIRFGRGDREWSLEWVGAPASGRLGLWLNNDSYPASNSLTHWSLEPTIGDSDSLHAAHTRQTSGTIEPGGSVSMQLRIIPT